MGQHEAAIKAADETIAVIQNYGDLFILPEMLRVKGSILVSAHEAETTAAEQCFLSALDLAARQGPWPGNCERQRPSLVCDRVEAAVTRREGRLRVYTIASPKGLTVQIWWRREACWAN
jgi:hypothetical protein